MSAEQKLLESGFGAQTTGEEAPGGRVVLEPSAVNESLPKK